MIATIERLAREYAGKPGIVGKIGLGPSQHPRAIYARKWRAEKRAKREENEPMPITKIRELSIQDAARIHCHGTFPDGCEKMARFCEHVEWDTGNTKGISFFYVCADHRSKPEAPRGTSNR